VEYSINEDLKEVRKILSFAGAQSWTSEKYQNDIYSFILQNQNLGVGVVELGCYKGGLSVFLSYACQKLGFPFYTIDLEPQFVNETRTLLRRLDLAKNVVFFQGTLAGFVSEVKLKDPPLLVVVDGDHQYQGVFDDIRSLHQMQPRSYAAAFHDFSLRHDQMPDERVDKTIYDFFGSDVDLARIGEQFDIHTSHPLKERPSPDGHYWELNGSEGVIVKLPVKPPVKQGESVNFAQSVTAWWREKLRQRRI